MSKYYKAEDVIKCVAQYIMTDAKIDNSYVCGDIEDYIEFTEAILADLPTIDIAKCEECNHNENTCVNHGEMMPRCRYTNYRKSADDFCSYGERIEE